MVSASCFLAELSSFAPLKTIRLLGIDVACATYRSALETSCELAKGGRPAAVSASNTHIISAARRDPTFAEVLRRFDVVLPDGMPLIWSLNLGGAALEDRVYGPYFMNYALVRTPKPWRHFFFGGIPETLEAMVVRARQIQPDIDVAGVYSPPFRKWTEEDEIENARQIAESGADFIWVALGGERQERWIIGQQHRFTHGVFFAVGDAFELLAGHRPFAPRWMQKRSLTWVYRLWQEPTRLWRRYLFYNTLFLYYLLTDGIRRRAIVRHRNSPLRIAFMGSRGVPARYSGFETVVEELGARLADRGHRVTVYNRSSYYEGRPETYRGMKLVYLPALMTKSFETITHTIASILHGVFHRLDLVYLCGVGNAPLAWLFHLRGWRVVINTDGIDFRRRKWRGFARWWLRRSEKMARFFSDEVVVDNGEVVKHYEESHGFSPVCIKYGSTSVQDEDDPAVFERLGVRPGEYLLYVARLTPENDAALLLEAYKGLPAPPPLLVVGPVGYEKGYESLLHELATPSVIFTGPIYDNGYRTLSRNCRLFVLPAAIEATRVVLLDQMGFGNAIVYRDVAATREVIGDAGAAFSSDNMAVSLRAVLARLIADPEKCRELGRKAKARADELYRWEPVTDDYETLFAKVMGWDESES